VTLADFVYPV